MTTIEASNFSRLIGIWVTKGTIFTKSDNVALIGIDTYEYILNENYILHKADVKLGDERTQTFEIISLTNAKERAKKQYYNSKGESGSMASYLSKNVFKIKSST